MWSAIIDLPKGSSEDSLKDALAKAHVVHTEDTENQTGEGFTGAELDSAVTAAGASATAMLTSGAYGNLADHAWRVEMRGHANQKNETPGGLTARDYGLVSIHQLKDDDESAVE